MFLILHPPRYRLEHGPRPFRECLFLSTIRGTDLNIPQDPPENVSSSPASEVQKGYKRAKKQSATHPSTTHQVFKWSNELFGCLAEDPTVPVEHPAEDEAAQESSCRAGLHVMSELSRYSDFVYVDTLSSIPFRSLVQSFPRSQSYDVLVLVPEQGILHDDLVAGFPNLVHLVVKLPANSSCQFSDDDIALAEELDVRPAARACRFWYTELAPKMYGSSVRLDSIGC
jgi:hypothetical protein